MNLLDLLNDFCQCIIDVLIAIASFLWIPIKYILTLDLLIVIIGALLLFITFIYHKVRK